MNDSLKRLWRVSTKRLFKFAKVVVANAANITEDKVIRLVAPEHLRKHVLHGPPVAMCSTVNASAHEGGNTNGEQLIRSAQLR
jgi:hypothetical protein